MSEKKYVPEGWWISCDKGTCPSQLRVTHDNNTNAFSVPLGTEADIIPFFNIKPIGICTITKGMCIPAIFKLKWENTKNDVKVNGNKVLKEDSYAQCLLTGKLELHETVEAARAACAIDTGGKGASDYLKDGFDWVFDKVDSLQDKTDGLLNDMGAPQWLKDVKNGVDDYVDFQVGVVEGIAQGAVGTVEGIVGIIQDPVGTVEAVGGLAKKGYDWASKGENWEKAADWASKSENWQKTGSDISNWASKQSPRDWGNIGGQSIFEVASTVATGGAAKAGTAARIADKAADAARVMDKVADAGKLLNAAKKIPKVIAKAAKEAFDAGKKKIDDAMDAVKKKIDEVFNSGKKCKDPVDPITGHVFYNYTDFELPGPIPFSWTREYNSGSKYKGILSYGVYSAYDLQLIENFDNNSIEVLKQDGTSYALKRPEEGGLSFHAKEQVEVYHHKDSFKIFDYKTRLYYTYQKIYGEVHKPVLIQDERLFSIQFFYNGNQLVRIIDSRGQELEVRSNHQGYVTQINLPAPSENRILVQYEYDDQGNMIGVYDALKQKTLIEYDNHHRMIKKTDRNGQSFYWQYDSLGRCTYTYGDNNLLEGTFEYHAGYTILTDPTGLKETYHYNKAFQCTKITDAFGNSKRFEYDQKGRLIKETDEEGLETTHTFDDNGNLVTTELPDGGAYTFVYDEQNRLILSADPGGNHNKWAYRENKLFFVQDAAQRETYFSYNENNLITKIRNEDDYTFLEYDKQYNLTRMILPDGRTTEWTYNDFGECTEVINPLGKKQQFEYDRLGRLQQIKLPTAEVIDLKYDAYDNVLKINGLRNKINFTYTPLGSIKSREENGVKVTFDYDTQERLNALSNEQGDQYKFFRNKRGDIVQEVSFDGITKYYNRDRAGKVVKIKREGNRFTEYEYDKGGRIIRADYHDGYWEAFSYNKAGLLVKATTPDNDVFFVRDGYGRVIQEKQGEHRIEYQYDKKGNLLALKSSLGADIAYERDHYGQISAITAGAGESPWATHIHRNMLGLEIERTLPGGIVSSWSYDAENNPIKQTVTRGQEKTLNRTYGWNANQQLHQITNAISGGMTEFGYDAFQSLAWAKYEDGSKDYKMPDEVGSLFRTRERKDRIYGKGGKLLKDENWYYNYDTEGNLKLKSKRNIAQAQLQNRQLQLEADKPKKQSFFIEEIEPEKPKQKTLEYYLRTDIPYTREEKEEYKRLKEQMQVETEEWQHGDWLYTWQANGMLKSVKKPDGSVVEFEYDALGRRTAKIHQEKVTRFVWDGNVLLHEWNYEQKKRPRFSLDDKGEFVYTSTESIENLITWVYEDGSFVPSAKIIGEERQACTSL